MCVIVEIKKVFSYNYWIEKSLILNMYLIEGNGLLLNVKVYQSTLYMQKKEMKGHKFYSFLSCLDRKQNLRMMKRNEADTLSNNAFHTAMWSHFKNQEQLFLESNSRQLPAITAWSTVFIMLFLLLLLSLTRNSSVLICSSSSVR